MKVNITHLGSNEWFNYKSDIIFGLYHTLTKIGHDVTIGHNEFSLGRHNIIIGADWVDQDLVSQLTTSKIEYSIFEIEAYDGVTVNHRNSFNNDSYRKLIESAVMILTPYMYNIKSYESIGYVSKVIYSPWGFYDEIVDHNINADYSKIYLGCFVGLLKGDRARKIDEIKKRRGNKIAVISNTEPNNLKAYYLGRSKYGLSLASGEVEHFVNPFRLYYMQANGIQVISDSETDDDDYLRYAIKAKDTDILNELEKDPPCPRTIKEMVATIELMETLKQVF